MASWMATPPVGRALRSHHCLLVFGGVLGGATLGALMAFLGWVLNHFEARRVFSVVLLSTTLLLLAVPGARVKLKESTWRRQVPVLWGKKAAIWPIGWGAWLGAGFLSHAVTIGFPLLIVTTIVLLEPALSALIGVLYGGSRAVFVSASAAMARRSNGSLHRFTNRERSASGRLDIVFLIISVTLTVLVLEKLL